MNLATQDQTRSLVNEKAGLVIRAPVHDVCWLTAVHLNWVGGLPSGFPRSVTRNRAGANKKRLRIEHHLGEPLPTIFIQPFSSEAKKITAACQKFWGEEMSDSYIANERSKLNSEENQQVQAVINCEIGRLRRQFRSLALAEAEDIEIRGK